MAKFRERSSPRVQSEKPRVEQIAAAPHPGESPIATADREPLAEEAAGRGHWIALLLWFMIFLGLMVVIWADLLLGLLFFKH